MRPTPHRPTLFLEVALGVASLWTVAACGEGNAPAETVQLPAPEAFWASLQSLCGQAFGGRMVEGSPQDSVFVGRTLTMHVRECGDDRVAVPFHVGEDRSRTWVFTLTDEGLRLKHDHRHEDGSEDAVTQYGGDAAGAGTAERQEFPADAFTTGLLPAAATNVWTVEILPGRTFVYALRREGTDRRVRVEFDLTRPVPPPPAPWGAAPDP
jgi:hypothetical protein